MTANPWTVWALALPEEQRELVLAAIYETQKDVPVTSVAPVIASLERALDVARSLAKLLEGTSPVKVLEATVEAIVEKERQQQPEATLALAEKKAEEAAKQDPVDSERVAFIACSGESLGLVRPTKWDGPFDTKIQGMKGEPKILTAQLRAKVAGEFPQRTNLIALWADEEAAERAFLTIDLVKSAGGDPQIEATRHYGLHNWESKGPIAIDIDASQQLSVEAVIHGGVNGTKYITLSANGRAVFNREGWGMPDFRQQLLARFGTEAGPYGWVLEDCQVTCS